MGHYPKVLNSDWDKATSTTQKSDTLGAKTTHFNTHYGVSKTFTNVQELIKTPRIIEFYRLLSKKCKMT